MNFGQDLDLMTTIQQTPILQDIKDSIQAIGGIERKRLLMDELAEYHEHDPWPSTQDGMHMWLRPSHDRRHFCGVRFCEMGDEEADVVRRYLETGETPPDDIRGLAIRVGHYRAVAQWQEWERQMLAVDPTPLPGNLTRSTLYDMYGANVWLMENGRQVIHLMKPEDRVRWLLRRPDHKIDAWPIFTEYEMERILRGSYARPTCADELFVGDLRTSSIFLDCSRRCCKGSMYYPSRHSCRSCMERFAASAEKEQKTYDLLFGEGTVCVMCRSNCCVKHGRVAPRRSFISRIFS